MVTRKKIADVFSQAPYTSFLEYCNICNHIFVDELTPVDFIAYKAKYDVDPVFIKQLKREVDDFKSSVVLLQQESAPELVASLGSVSSTINNEGSLFIHDNQGFINATYSPIIEDKPTLEDKEKVYTAQNNRVEIIGTINEETIDRLESVLDSTHFMSGRVAMAESIYFLNFSVRSTNALINSGIKTISQLVELDLEELSQIRSLGAKSITEILTKIEELKNKFSSLESRYFLPRTSDSIG